LNRAVKKTCRRVSGSGALPVMSIETPSIDPIRDKDHAP